MARKTRKPKVNCRNKQNIHLTACRNAAGQFTSRGKGYAEAMKGKAKKRSAKKASSGLPKAPAKCITKPRMDRRLNRCVCKTSKTGRGSMIKTKYCKRK